ncbi:MAG: hypothetical protein KGI75_09265, partial [Rhizobiaceae bacterium]|nr:hypothetical protein [Rhizobiaceae bacterium]
RRANPVWPMREGGRIVERMLSGTLLVNNGETIRRMAIAGAGIGRIADYHVREPIARGELVEVLADSSVVEFDDIHALYRGAQLMPTRVRAFLDFTVPRMQKFLATDPTTEASPIVR